MSSFHNVDILGFPTYGQTFLRFTALDSDISKLRLCMVQTKRINRLISGDNSKVSEFSRHVRQKHVERHGYKDQQTDEGISLSPYSLVIAQNAYL